MRHTLRHPACLFLMAVCLGGAGFGLRSVRAAEPVLAPSSGSASAPFTPIQQQWWSLQPVRSTPPPPVSRPDWVRTPIDAFILARLESAGLSPAGPADRRTLLRRVYLDLTGLPPTPAEVSAFVEDRSPDAWRRVVERLLASPEYGGRWARHWLDLARYAESEGFKADETRPNAWRYRDYVIRAFNADKPYDRFVQEQLAGVELWPGDPEATVATGFNRHYPDESNARNLMQRRQDILNDMTDTTGAVFSGLTFACARCHDHKWDPIRQVDYFRLQAFFANTAAQDQHVLLSDPERSRYEERLARWQEETWAIREAMEAMEQPHRKAILDDYVTKYPENIQVALRKSAEERTPFESQMVAKARLYLDPASHQYLAPASACVGRMKAPEKAKWTELKRQLDAFASLHPGPLPLATGLMEVAPEPPPTHLLKRGMWDAPREEVAPGFLSLLDPQPTPIRPVAYQAPEGKGGTWRSSGRRAALARVLTDPANPLTARVMVNRIWQHHFGRGLVGTPSDFGLKGEAPTHPELLDWLAQEFVRSGWSVKHMHRLILQSAVYATASTRPPAEAARTRTVDPANQWLGHFPRTRLEGETIRDAALHVSGRLNPRMGGPSVFPELPPGMETRGGWPVTKQPEERDRRSVYVFVRRNTRYPMFESLDQPDTHETCARRGVTTSPVQALTLLNSGLSHDWARSFALRVLAEAGADEPAQLRAAWRWAYGRELTPGEATKARDFLARQRGLIAERRAQGETVVTFAALPAGTTPDHGAALMDLCHALLNSNEFVYRD
jgi:hypothetical protein